jgi:hypothetical protein
MRNGTIGGHGFGRLAVMVAVVLYAVALAVLVT